jgi:hypothetical protein
MSKVYILNDGGHDYSAATEFGELTFLNIPYNVMQDIPQAFTYLKNALKDAGPDDSLLIGGPASMNCIATAILAEWYGCVNFLLYKGDRYEPSTIVTNNS